MDERRLAELLRLKRAREQRAAARAVQAQGRAAEAETARQVATQIEAQHATERPAREAAAYGRLLVAPLPVHAVQSEAALLSGLAAYAGVLRAQTNVAASQAADCAQAARETRTAHTAAARSTEAALAIARAAAASIAAQDERHAELEDEDLGPALQARGR
jgi:hypothetical protein